MSDQTKQPASAPVVPDFQHAPQGAEPTYELIQRVIAETLRQGQDRAARPSPFDLRTFEEIEAFCERVTRSNLCPKDFKGKSDDAIIAVLMGKELGLPAMASLQSIAVINGRPTLWGEAVPGICLATGQVKDVVEHFEGDNGTDVLTAVCTVTRRGLSPREGRFSIADAKVAGLANVHRQYPKDMIMWRARHRAWHGAFPDVLKGIGIAEIEQDEADRLRWIMPRPERADAQRSAKAVGDTWNDGWFDGIARKLFEEQDPWRWMDALLDALKAAPSARDVKEIETLGSVARVSASAPEDAKVTIAAAFRDATARFTAQKAAATTPAKPAGAADAATGTQQQQPVAEEAEEGTGFEYALMDETGDPVDGVFYTSALDWARAFAAVADPRTMGYMAIREHNADALQDARLDPDAAKIVDAIEAEADIGSALASEGAEGATAEAPPVIEPTITRGKPDWPQYIRDLTAAAMGETRETLHAFANAQREKIEKFPQSLRMQATKVMADRAKELAVTPPPGFAAKAPAPANDAAPSAEHKTAETDKGPPQADKDQRTLDNFLEDLAKASDVHEVRRYTNQATVTTTLARWEREGKEALAQQLRQAVAAREAELKAAK